MNIIKWSDPTRGLTSLHSQLDDMFNSLLDSTNTKGTSFLPAMDIYNEDDKQLVAEVHAPGVTKEDIDVNVQNDVLEIQGEHKETEESKMKKRNYMMRESQASFYRRIALPKNADAAKVSANFEDGMLRVIVPYKKLPAPKKIAIESGNKSKK